MKKNWLQPFTLDLGMLKNFSGKQQSNTESMPYRSHVTIEWLLLHLSVQGTKDLQQIETLKFKDRDSLSDLELFIQFSIMFMTLRTAIVLTELGLNGMKMIACVCFDQ